MIKLLILEMKKKYDRMILLHGEAKFSIKI